MVVFFLEPNFLIFSLRLNSHQLVQSSFLLCYTQFLKSFMTFLRPIFMFFFIPMLSITFLIVLIPSFFFRNFQHCVHITQEPYNILFYILRFYLIGQTAARKLHTAFNMRFVEIYCLNPFFLHHS